MLATPEKTEARGRTQQRRTSHEGPEESPGVPLRVVWNALGSRWRLARLEDAYYRLDEHVTRLIEAERFRRELESGDRG